MGKRRYRRKTTKIQSNIEWIVVGGIVLYALSKKLLQAIQQFFLRLEYGIQSMSAVDWFLIIVIVGSLIFILYMFFNNRNIKCKRFKQEQAMFRVIRDSEYQQIISLNPTEFENYVANLFRTKGYDAEVTPPTGDGGKDVILRKNNEISLVECKKYNENHKVSRPEIQKFHSALIDMEAKEGFFVTTGYFTHPAMNYSINKPIKLIDLPRLMEMIEEVKNNKKK